MSTELIIFDFDGVVADSEYLACGVAADFATELGYPLTVSQGIDMFIGKRASDVANLIAKGGGRIPADFEQLLLERTIETFDRELQPIEGVEWFLKKTDGLKRCIASSSSHKRINSSLRKIQLERWFEGRVFSVDDVSRGKPFPDVFLHAAKMMEVEPSSSVVIEDSVTGVSAAAAAGMKVVGLLAGSHIQSGHGKKLKDAGARAIAKSYVELSQLLDQI